MAVTNLGRPHSGGVSATEIVAIPVPRWHKQALEDEARAMGYRSMADFMRAKLDWPDVSRRMGPKTKEVQQA